MQRLLRTYYVTTVLCALCVTGSLNAAPVAQMPDSVQVAKAEQDSVRISLVTFYPGSEPHNIFGHSELRVQQGNADLYFNYGVYDFSSPGFIWRFMLGDTYYLCDAIPRAYCTLGMDGRRMVEQELNLPQDKALQVKEFLMNNARPENRTYHYKFLTDNCSTRPRDIIEMATGSSMKYPTMPSDVTYRDILSQYCKNYAWEKFGIDLVLGWDADTVLSPRAQMFIPMLLMKAVAEATVVNNGVTMPLVARTTVPVDASEQGLVLPPTPSLLSPMAIALLVLAITLIVTYRDWRRRDISRLWDTLIYVIAGLAGCIIFFLMCFSTHEATSPNINIVWLNPLLLLLAILPWFKKGRPVGRVLHAIYAVVTLLLMLAWPWQPQTANIAFWPLMTTLVTRSVTNVLLGSQTTRGPTHKG